MGRVAPAQPGTVSQIWRVKADPLERKTSYFPAKAVSTMMSLLPSPLKSPTAMGRVAPAQPDTVSQRLLENALVLVLYVMELDGKAVPPVITPILSTVASFPNRCRPVKRDSNAPVEYVI